VITEELEAFGAAEVTAVSELTRADRFSPATVLEGSMTTVFTTNWKGGKGGGAAGGGR